MSKSKAYHKQIGRYVQGKDGNQAHLFKAVFTTDAVLKMLVQSEQIDFPSEVIGLEAITQTLCTDFNQRFENIRTLCFLDSVLRSNNLMNCRWLVGMTSKETGELHIGYGEYHWTFELDESPLPLHQAKKLTIVIDDMILIPEEHAADCMAWVESCTYPWAIATDTLSKMPNFPFLSGVGMNLSNY